jgi:hypothetical protein
MILGQKMLDMSDVRVYVYSSISTGPSTKITPDCGEYGDGKDYVGE